MQTLIVFLGEVFQTLTIKFIFFNQALIIFL